MSSVVDDQAGRRFGVGACGEAGAVWANYHKPHGSRQFYAWYSLGADQLSGNLEPCTGSAATLRSFAGDPRQR